MNDLHFPDTFDEAARETARLLIQHGVWSRTPKGKGALDSVEAALQAGWSGAQCFVCVRDWLVYSRTHAGRWVQFPGRQAAARLRDQILPPPDPAVPDDPQRYISGEYAAYILHDQETVYS